MAEGGGRWVKGLALRIKKYFFYLVLLKKISSDCHYARLTITCILARATRVRVNNGWRKRIVIKLKLMCHKINQGYMKICLQTKVCNLFPICTVDILYTYSDEVRTRVGRQATTTTRHWPSDDNNSSSNDNNSSSGGNNSSSDGTNSSFSY